MNAASAIRRAHAVRSLRTLAVCALTACAMCGAVIAQGRSETGASWRELSASQRSALAPLEREWPRMDATRKQKWLEIATRFPKLPPAEQARVQARMADWTRMTPTERGQARLNYQQARQVPPDDRRSRWEAYQSLSPEQRRQLAARAEAESRPVPPPPRRAPADTPRAKSNIVPNPGLATPPRAVGPTIVQAKPGASTTLISERRAPPLHQQTGLPKIAASPDFVDRSTLLPQRGPQGAAVTPAPEPRKRRDNRGNRDP